MIDKRHELLRHLLPNPAKSIWELSRNLGRDFKRVHEDVTALERVALIERREDGRLTASYKFRQPPYRAESRLVRRHQVRLGPLSI
jgi:predicted transcriptional regulator